MTAERLQRLSYDRLTEIAEQRGVDHSRNSDKDSLIERILEAMKEDRDESVEANNSAIRGEEKKYDISLNEELEAPITEKFSIPDSYNETKIVLMLRDPFWAFAYWDFSNSDRVFVQNEVNLDKLLLRVYTFGGASPEKKSVFFDIPIKVHDNRRYINLSERGQGYQIQLICNIHRNNKILTVSNIIRSPRKYYIESSENDALISSTGILPGTHDVQDISSFSPYSSSSSYMENSPQRIIPMYDENYLHLKG